MYCFKETNTTNVTDDMPRHLNWNPCYDVAIGICQERRRGYGYGKCSGAFGFVIAQN